MVGSSRDDICERKDKHQPMSELYSGYMTITPASDADMVLDIAKVWMRMIKAEQVVVRPTSGQCELLRRATSRITWSPGIIHKRGPLNEAWPQKSQKHQRRDDQQGHRGTNSQHGRNDMRGLCARSVTTQVIGKGHLTKHQLQTIDGKC